MPITEKGMSRDDIFKYLSAVQQHDIDYKSGKAYGMVFSPNAEGAEIARKAYDMFLSTNGLDFSQFPSLLQLEKDITEFVAGLLGGGPGSAGTFTSGGTESIILALKSARDHARKIKPAIREPEVILPITAHAAHWKACHYLGLKAVRVPVNTDDFRVDPRIVEDAVTENTIAIVGSAPSYTYGVIDPITELGRLAMDKNLWLHVDACMGGILLPFYRKCGKELPPFDLSVPGVRSVSADLHKYGYCPKGASVVVYPEKSLRANQWFVGGQWLGYPLVNSTIQSTKSGGALAAAWAVLNHFGTAGYTDLARQHIEASDKLVSGMKKINGVHIPVDPDFCIFGFQTPGKRLFEVADLMRERGWFAQPVLGHEPFGACLHITISFQNFPNTDDFLADLEECVQKAGETKDDPVVRQMIQGLAQMPVESITPEFVNMAMQGFGLQEGEMPDGGMADVNEALDQLPSTHRNIFLKYFVNEVF